MWLLNSPELNPLDYHVSTGGIVGGLSQSQAPSKTEDIAA